MISRRTAELSLLAIDAVLRRTRHNGAAPPPELVQALRELHAAAADVSPTRQEWTAPVPATAELISVGQAARRLGVSNRTVERRATSGQLAANRVGRAWQIIWNEEGTTMAAQPGDTTQAEAPPRYRVTGELITVRTAGLAGIIAGRSGYAMVSLYRGAILPADVPEESIAHHLDKGLIEAMTE